MKTKSIILKNKNLPNNVNEELKNNKESIDRIKLELDSNKEIIDDIKEQMKEVFQNVSNGKELIASAITDKGIPTSSDATFQEMADNIKDIIDIDMVSPSWTIGIDTVTATCSTISGIFKEFRVNNGAWQTSTVFSGLTGNTQYTFEGKNIGGGTSSIVSTSPKANQSVPSAPTSSNVAHNSITVTAPSGCKIRYNSNLYNSPYTFTGLSELTTYSFYSVKEATTNLNEAVSTVLKVTTPVKPVIYGIDINEDNSDPNSAVTYTNDAVGFTPLYCGNGTLNYGSWANTFIIKDNKPCVFKDGVRQYYLNPNDYTKKEDGSASDITSGSAGDVMAEFKKCYYKLWKEGNIVKFRVANYKVDNTYCCNAFLSEDGKATEKDYMYISTYEGYSDGTKLRSLSGKTISTTLNVTSCRNLSTKHGSGYQQLTLSKWTFLIMIMTMVIKHLNHQLRIGTNRYNAGTTSVAYLTTGTMNTKGQFWGDQSTSNGIKAFHVENVYGNRSIYLDGLNNQYNTTKYKVTGPYSNDHVGYTDGFANIDLGYVSKMYCSNNNGIVAQLCEGSATTYYCDYRHTASSKTVAAVGVGTTTQNGPFSMEWRSFTSTYSSGRLTFS